MVIVVEDMEGEFRVVMDWLFLKNLKSDPDHFCFFLLENYKNGKSL